MGNPEFTISRGRCKSSRSSWCVAIDKAREQELPFNQCPVASSIVFRIFLKFISPRRSLTSANQRQHQNRRCTGRKVTTKTNYTIYLIIRCCFILWPTPTSNIIQMLYLIILICRKYFPSVGFRPPWCSYPESGIRHASRLRILIMRRTPRGRMYKSTKALRMTSAAGRLGCPFGQCSWNPRIAVSECPGILVSWQPPIRAREGVSESLSRCNCRVRGRAVVQLSDPLAQ